MGKKRKARAGTGRNKPRTARGRRKPPAAAPSDLPNARYVEMTRVTCHLPIGSSRELLAYTRFKEYLRDNLQPPGSRSCHRPGGFTHSRTHPPTMMGYWWQGSGNGKSGRWLADPLVVCFIDYEIDKLGGNVQTIMEELRAELDRLYRDAGVPQEAVWITAQNVWRWVAGDEMVDPRDSEAGDDAEP